jgi:peptidoglycan/LPS O-acetylase OafA/YrhL
MRRIPELDALRGLAAISIVAFHYSHGSPLHDRGLYLGGLALDLFFVLSGYLISSIILAHSEERGFVRNFYARRSLRIWPAYYLLVLSYAGLIAIQPSLGDIPALPQYLTFTQHAESYRFAQVRFLAYPLGPLWSLAVEEQFYLIWPLLLWLVGARRMAPLAVAGVVLAIAARSAGFSDRILIARCDGFAIGGLLAVALDGHRKRGGDNRSFPARLVLMGTAALLLFAITPGESPIRMTLSATLFACIIGAVVLAEGHPILAPLRARWLCYIGTISYGIYIYHLSTIVIGDVVCAKLRLPAVLNATLVAPALCLAVSAASWAWIEKPCLRLKGLFSYGRPGEAGDGSTAAVGLDEDRAEIDEENLEPVAPLNPL